MRKQSDPLKRIHTTSPCTADWDSMIGNAEVRFCSHCHLHVHNLSEMTRKEAIKLVLRSEGRLCLRYYRRPDGAIQTAALPERLHQIKRRASHLAAGAFTTALSLCSAVAAQTPSHDEQTASVIQSSTAGDVTRSQGLKDQNAAITGTIFDPTNAVIPNARVTLTNEKGKLAHKTTSSRTGEYRFISLAAGAYTLSVAAPGFKTTKVAINLSSSDERRVDTTLEVAATMGACVVISPRDQLVNAAMLEDLSAVKKLLAAGADVNIVDKEIDSTALSEAVKHGNREMVRVLLKAGADVNLRNHDGQTALMMLDKDATADLVRDLVAAGANVNLKDKDGASALIIAAASDNADVLQALLDAGAHVNAKNKEGVTALMKAAEEGNIDNVKVLIDAGADINKRDKEGATALKYARDNDRADVAQLLETHGAVE